MRYVDVRVIAFALAFPCACLAQTTPLSGSLQRGDHVRLAALGDAATMSARVVRTDSATLEVAPDDSTLPPRTLPLSEISHLEVERDARARTIGASVGALLGVAAGASYYYFGLCPQDERGCAQEQRRSNVAAEYDRTYVTTGDVLVIGGMIAGGVLGYFLAPAPHWTVIAAPGLMRDGEGDTHTAFRLGVSHTLLGR